MINMFGRRGNNSELESRIAELSARRARTDHAPLGAREGDGSGAIAEPWPEQTTSGVRSSRSDDKTPMGERLAEACEHLKARLGAEIRPERRSLLSRGDLAKIVDAAVQAYFVRHAIDANPLARRDLVTEIMQTLVTTQTETGSTPRSPHKAAVDAALAQILPEIVRYIDMAAAGELPRPELEAQITRVVPGLLADNRIQLNAAEQRELIACLVAELVGFGPIDRLLADETISNIIVSGPKQISVERRGKSETTDIDFRDEQHLMSVCSRIAARIGSRLDETQPLVSGRLFDGSQIKIMIPPLTVDSPAISIRKLPKAPLTLDTMTANQNLSPPMATVLKIACRCRLNILVSGLAGSGKTTLLNALARMIDVSERVVTIEQPAELRLTQPHVLRLETYGEMTVVDLLRQALPWQFDRMIVGECRGPEILELLGNQEGWMSTICALDPTDALLRLQCMSGANAPLSLIRGRLASAIDLICHVEHQPDGMWRVVQLTEVVGVEGSGFDTQDLFRFEHTAQGTDGRIRGVFQSQGHRPRFLAKAERYGLDRALLDVV